MYEHQKHKYKKFKIITDNKLCLQIERCYRLNVMSADMISHYTIITDVRNMYCLLTVLVTCKLHFTNQSYLLYVSDVR